MGPIVVVDYDAGNLRSVARAIERVDSAPLVSADPADIDRARAVVLPGVGAAADTMLKLRERGLVEPLKEYIAGGRPFLGVCMGLQALFDHSDEGGGQECLGVFGGNIRHFATGEGRKVPHMGWNTVDWTRDHPITEDIPSGSAFYFVHSFYPVPLDPSVALGMTEYGVTFPSVVARDNVIATQFHPEKSSDHGLLIYRNFIRWARAGMPAAEPAVAGSR
ncbi:MAG: imidazole glycerol phosphate synthase subunit HisH [Dehalococcoidia bacterium]